MRPLISLGILLIVAWMLGLAVFKVAGFLIHLLLIAGVILVAVGLAQRVRARIESPRP